MAKKKRSDEPKSPVRRKSPGAAPDRSADSLAPKPKSRMKREVSPDLSSESSSSQCDRAIGSGCESKAELLMVEAFTTHEPRRRCELARAALRIWPDCIAAHILLGTAELDDEKRLERFQQAIASARRVIGNPPLDLRAGDESGNAGVAPLMGALMEASNSLWALNRYEESLAQLQEILRLVPDDPLGTRYILLNRLLFLNQNDAARKLLDQFSDDRSIECLYSRALLVYRQFGDIPAARQALRAARKANKFVPEYLVGNSALPCSTPTNVRYRSRTEAEWYCSDAMRLWRDTPGAVPWVRDTLKVPLPKAPQERADRRSWLRRKSKLVDLPQDPDEVWMVGLEPLASPNPDEPNLPATWGFVVISAKQQEVVVGEFSETQPTPNKILGWLINAMLRPNDGDPRRPRSVHVSDSNLAQAWREPLHEIQVDCLHSGPLEVVQSYLEMLRHEANRQTHGAEVTLLDDAALAALPQVSEEWELDIRLLAAFIGDRGTPRRPWTVLIGDCTNEFVIAQDLSVDEPAADWSVRVLRSAMGQPCVGPSRRPVTIRVATVDQHGLLAHWLQSLGVRCVISENLDFLDRLFADVTRHLAGDGSLPGILAVPGVTPETAAGAFDAAAEFYRATPWRIVPPDVPIQIETTSFQSGPWYAIVMGQSGMLQGLALYEDWRVLRKMLDGQVSEKDSLRKTTSLAVYYGEAFDFPATDLNDLDRLGWQVAGPEAYPTVLRINPGMNIRRPLAWELQLLEATLRALIQFTASGVSQPVEYDISTSAGLVHLRLDWMR